MTLWQVAVFWLSAAVVWLAVRNAWLKLQLEAMRTEYIRLLYRSARDGAGAQRQPEDTVLDSEVIE